nr:hypothetical protein BHE74_00042776 [Ipomoea batatas]
MATQDPSLSFALYTVPNLPSPILLDAEKFPVPLQISSKDKSTVPNSPLADAAVEDPRELDLENLGLWPLSPEKKCCGESSFGGFDESEERHVSVPCSVCTAIRVMRFDDSAQGKATPSAMPSNIRMRRSIHIETSAAHGVRNVAKDHRATPQAMTTFATKIIRQSPPAIGDIR